MTTKGEVAVRKERVLVELQASIVVVGGVKIPIQELGTKSLFNILDLCLTNDIRFEVSPFEKYRIKIKTDEYITTTEEPKQHRITLADFKTAWDEYLKGMARCNVAQDRIDMIGCALNDFYNTKLNVLFKEE